MTNKRVTFEMTGNVSAKSIDRGIKYKKDFIAWARKFGWEHTSIESMPTYLIASKEGTKKHQFANRYGIEIISYEDALDMMEDIRYKISLI